MSITTRVLMAVVLAWLGGSAAYAVQPAYVGPLGNCEEPALRPYKWLWRGVKALVYQPVAALEEGNRKTPLLGSAEVVRGMRTGSVELGESVFRGVIGTVPPGPGDYRRLGSVNALIDREPLLNGVMDLAACCYVFAFSTHNTAVKAALALFVTEQIVTRHPLVGADERARLEQQAKDVREARKRARTESAIENPVHKAQTAYLGERLVINRKEPFSGDILKSMP